MKAARLHRYGGPEAVVIEEISRPEAGRGQVLVKVAAAGVNPVDWKIREGYLKSGLPIELPITLGCDLSGTIEAIGEGVTGLEVGQAVYGYPSLLRCGAYAEFAILEPNELAAAPTAIPLEASAALPVAAITAYEGLFTHGRLEAGQKVLILGGAGGVGSAAIQLAKHAGAEVFATASARNQERVRALGATAIDYESQQTADIAQEVDLLFDCVGVESGIAALPSLRKGGAYVTTAYALPPEAHLSALEARGVIYGIQPSSALLAKIAKLVDDGALRLEIEKVYTLDETREALKASQTSRTRGKLLIRP